MRAVDDLRTARYGNAVNAPPYRRAVEPLSCSDGTRPVHRYVRVAPLASRLPPLELVSDTACPPQLKWRYSTARRSAACSM